MYKDVWKKFGVKALIVLCSVLLVGGVAIAAPRLRADVGTKYSLSELQQWYNADPTNNIVVKDVYYSTNPADNIPISITVKSGSGIKVELTPDCFDNSIDNVTVGAGSSLNKAGEVTLTIRAKAGLGMDTPINPGGEFTFKYTIKPNLLPTGSEVTFETDNHNAYGAQETDWIVNAEANQLMATNIIGVYLKQGETKVPLAKDEYALNITNTQTLGDRDVDITLTNYAHTMGGTDQTWNLKCKVVKDITNTVSGTSSADIKVLDPETNQQLAQNCYSQSGDSNQVEIVGNRSANYVGKAVLNFGGGGKGPVVKFADNEYINGYKEYDSENTGYEFKPNLIITNEEEATGGRNIGNKYTATYRIIDGNRNPIPGATAGTVEMTITVTDSGSNFNGQTATNTLEYQVRRDISGAEFIEPDEPGDYTYSPSDAHAKTPKVSFDGTNALRSNDVGKVEYWLAKRQDETWQERKLVQNPKDAGIVYMKVFGSLGETSPTNTNLGGYYGVLDGYGNKPHQQRYGRYTINALSLDANQQLRLQQNEKVRVFPISEKEPEISESTGVAYLFNGTYYDPIEPKERDIEYTVEFFKDEQCTVPIEDTEWKTLPTDQTYYVKYKFISNYDGERTAPFKIHAYTAAEIDISFTTDACTGGSECTPDTYGSGHIYNGQPHHPAIIVKTNSKSTTSGVELTEGTDYEVSYSEDVTNVNPATPAKVIVTLKSSKETKEKEFTVSPLSIDNDADTSITLKLPSSEYTGNPPKRVYSGRAKRPNLKSLTFGKPALADSLTMNSLAEYEAPDAPADTARDDFKVLGLFEQQADGSWTEVRYSTRPELSLTKNYRFKVQGNGNYKDIGYSEQFQFEQRDINEAERVQQPESMPDADKDTSIEDILKFLRSKTTGLKLKDLGDELDMKEPGKSGDYEIHIGKGADEDKENTPGYTNPGDLRTTEGKIVYQIVGTGCYTGIVKDQVLYIGRNIADALLWEANEEVKIINGVRKLKNSYSVDTATEYNIPYWKGGANENKAKAVYPLYNKSAVSETLIQDTHYKVSYGNAQDRNEGQAEGQYCVATLQGVNGYYGTLQFEFDINVISIEDCVIDVQRVDFWYDDEQGAEWIYTGSEIKPDVRIYPKGTAEADKTNANRLVEGKHYKLEYSKNIEANEENYEDKSVITIIGLSAYSGSKTTRSFTIHKRDLSVNANQDPEGIGTMAPYFHIREAEGTITKGDRLGEKYNYKTTSTVLLPDGSYGSSNGVCPQFELLYYPEGTGNNKEPIILTINAGFTLSYRKNTHKYDHTDTNNYAPADSPEVIVTAQGRNFKGKFRVYFDIQPVNLSECIIKMTSKDIPFTGSSVAEQVKALVQVYQLEVNDKGEEVEVLLPQEHAESNAAGAPTVKEYEIKVENDIFVPNLSNQEAGMPIVWIEATKEGNCIGDKKKNPYQFNIIGDLARDPLKHPEGAANSEIHFETTYVDFAKPFDIKTALEKIQDLEFRQKNAATNQWVTNKLDPEFDYNIDLDASRIGSYMATVSGKGTYEGNIKNVPVVVRANLSDLSYMTYEYPKPFSYVTGQAIDFKKLIRVKCGDEYLEYGTHYQFRGGEESLDTLPGNNYPITIEPAGEGKDQGYITGAYAFTYDIKAGLDNSAVITIGKFDPGTEARYEYAHGYDVFNPNSEIKVTVGGTELRPNKDYTIEIIGDLKNCGQKTIKITGINSYAGETTRNFTIYPYDIGLHKDDMKIAAKDSVVFNGAEAFPDRNVYVTVSGNSQELKAAGGENEEAGEYVIEKDSGDTVNWTHDPNNKPTFAIRGIGNYTGRLTGNAYTIKRKPISDPDIVFAAIDPQPYQNGREIRMVPKGVFNERDLLGELRDPNKEDQYLNAPGSTSKEFTWTYVTQDLKSVGTKQVLIEGIGNFTGRIEYWEYEVVALELKDTVLTFDNESPVYDGREQLPSFKLTYGSDTIAVFTGTQLVSEWIKNLKYEFRDNIDAGTATVRIWVDEGKNDNYSGEKTATFTILPASIAGHTKFMYRPSESDGNVDLSTYKLNLPFDYENHSLVRPKYAVANEEGKLPELPAGQVGIYFDFASKRNHGDFLIVSKDYEADIQYQYVMPDTEDEPVREEDYPDPNYGYAGKVKVTIKGMKNYTDTASFWYYIGKDISAEASISMSPTTTVYNSQAQPPVVKVTGINDESEYKIAKYKDEIAVKNLIDDKGFVNAGTYYIRVEGNPANGTYATKPHTLTYTITPRAFSNSLVIDGFKREYSYTGYEICPVGISVTDYIDKIKYRLTEDVDYTLTYTNNLNAGTAYINIKGQNNFSGTATANFMITSSTISGGWNGSNSFLDQGTGEISGATAVSPNDVNLSMDTIDAMYYTGKPVYPKVSISGMTENVDYTVTFGNNVEVGTAVATINGIGNNNGTITKNFRIIAQLSKCTISPIPAQQYTGSEVKPSLTVKCGNTILMEGTDYNVTYSNNINIGTATATIRALNNANYTGTASVKFSIGNDVGGFIISGYAPSYAYTGKAITPGVVVETGSRTLIPGTEYTVSYSNNVNAGTATITVTGVGKYSGKQTANFVIEPKSMQSLDTTDVADRTYTGDAYTPDITVSDGGKVLTKGVDYTVTYSNNTNPGVATIKIQGTSSNYTGTKIISFRISAVAVKGLKASNVKYNSMKLKWTKQGYADGYQLCDSKSKVIKNVKTNSVTITGLSAGKTYKYKVRSYIRNADGTKSYGAFSAVLNATTKLRTPNVKVVSNAKGQARISWSKVSGASGYEIYYKKSSGAKYKKLKTVNNPNIRVCTVRGMKSGDRAYFRIRAFRKNGSKKVYSSLNPLKVITVK